MSGQNLRFFFAWVLPTETTFGPQHLRWDTFILKATVEHDEGQIPMMTIEIPNPGIGLLSAGRNYWVWFSVSVDGAPAVPLFFGRIIGLPTDLSPSAMTIQVKLIARPQDYISAKQLAVEPYKNTWMYDPVFIDPTKRDDPDTILEGVSGLIHVDRVTGAVSVSDVLIGEDGTVDFTGNGDVFMDSVHMHLDQSPLVAVNVKANVRWRQQYTGFFDVASGGITTYTGEGIIEEWPKTGQTLGGGYTVAVGYSANLSEMVDIAQTAGNYGYHYTWQNTAHNHHTGDTMSVDVEYSLPQLGLGIPNQATAGRVNQSASSLPGVGNIISFIYRSINIPGIINPNNYDAEGYPDPINIPASDEMAWIEIPSWNAIYALSLMYQADRQRTESIEFTLSSDVQPTLADPLVTEDTETITLPGADVSLPILTFDNWSTVAGQYVPLSTFVFPDNPSAPGQTSTQVSIVPGVAGTVEPTFSNVPGVETVDGGVTWVSLGNTQPSQTLPDWQRLTPIALGSRLCPRPQPAVDINSLVLPGLLSFPPKPTALSMYQLFANGDAYPGAELMEVTYPGFYPTAQLPVSSPATWDTFTNPTGKTWWICTGAGTTGQFRTSFPDTPGAVVEDGTVTWTCVGFVDLPIGGWPGMTGRSAYFPTDRGLQSIQYLIARARAKLRWRARVAKVTWQCPYANAIPLSCRKNATILYSRLPGGLVGGKVIAYKLVADGDHGLYYGDVTIGASAGNANAIIAGAGTATYVDGVFNQGEVQTWAGAAGSNFVLVLPTDDVGFTPPVSSTVDDGLVFPLQGQGDAILNFTIGGSQEVELEAITNAIEQSKFENWNGYTFPVSAIGGAATLSQTAPNYLAVTQAFEMAGQVGLWGSLSLRPLNIGPFDAGYVLDTTPLSIAKTVDLEAPNLPSLLAPIYVITEDGQPVITEDGVAVTVEAGTPTFIPTFPPAAAFPPAPTPIFPLPAPALPPAPASIMIATENGQLVVTEDGNQVVFE